MENFSSNGISSQLIIIFTLVLVVGLLLVVIIFLDKKEKLKKKKNDYEEDYDDNFTFEDLYQKDSSKEEELIELESANKIIEEDKNESIQENLTPYTENLLKEEAETLGIADKLEIVGKIPDIKPYLSKFDVFAYPLNPNHYGTAEQVLQEAMAAGIVPVVMNNPAEKILVKHNNKYLNKI